MHALDISKFKELTNLDYLVVDARQPLEFCEGFVKHSVSVPFSQNFIAAYQGAVEDGQKAVLIADEKDLPAITSALKYAGIANIAAVLQGGFTAWKDAGLKTDMLITIEPDEFAIDYKFDEFYLVDVRPAEDFTPEHIEDAENIPLEEVENMSIDLETGGNYYLYGATFAEAVAAASLLKRNGFERVRIVSAGYDELKAAGLPVYTQKKKENSSAKFSNN